MKNFSLFILAACINVLFAILLINKQNMMITLLYKIQHLQEEHSQLLGQKKDIIFQLHKEQQLANIQSFATQQLHMKPLKIKEAKTISLPKEKYGNNE